MAIRSKSQRSKPAPGKYLSEAQLKKLLRYVENKANLARRNGATRAIIDELIIQLLVNTGLRPRELCNLNIEDLPLSHGQNALLVRDSRGDITREIDINSKIAKSLQMFVRLYRKGAKLDDPLIISERGNRFTYMSLYSKVKNIGRKAEIGWLYPHMLRRTYMVRLYNAEHYLRLVQEQAGHANWKTTAIYVKNKHEHKQKK